MTLSIRETFAGRHVLVTGTSGFVGKVWLAMVLDSLPEVARFYVLLRKKGLRPVTHRFEKIVNTSPVFKPLHEKHGAELGHYMAARVEVIEGDISAPDFGMDARAAERLKRDLDLVVNCAGLVDFNPDVRLAMATNIDGAIGAAEFVSECDNARLLHVSTCYVAGNRSGSIGEEIVDGYAPCGDEFDPQAEYEDAQAVAERLESELETPEAEEELAQHVLEGIRKRGMDETSPALVKNMTRRKRAQRIKRVMVKEGERRAARWGWPNTYTWSKSISEQLLQRRAAELGVEFSVVRPAIVESSQTFPFPGWNEGFNTSGPLVYLLGTWFKHLPGKKHNAFDVIPVDMLCKGITLVGAALLAGEAQRVYQTGTSHSNPISIDRAVELTALAHRVYLRKHGETALDRVVLSRWDGARTPVEHMFSVPNIRKTARGLSGLLRRTGGKAPGKLRKQAEQAADALGAADKQLKGVQRVCELFQPFIHDNAWVFESTSMRSHRVAEPEFRFEPASINWRDYWMNVHVPGLRRWCFPQFEGKAIPTYAPEHVFKLALLEPSSTPRVAARARMPAAG